MVFPAPPFPLQTVMFTGSGQTEEAGAKKLPGFSREFAESGDSDGGCGRDDLGRTFVGSENQHESDDRGEDQGAKEIAPKAKFTILANIGNEGDQDQVGNQFDEHGWDGWTVGLCELSES